MKSLQHIPTATVSVVLSVAALAISSESAEAFGLGGDVLSPYAIVEGYSLADAAKEIALWQDTFDPAQLPNVPYQPLTLASLNYTVTPGTYLYVPLASGNDSPPILGTFPSNLTQAISYFFGPSQIGGKDFKITVNGKVTEIGPSYLTAPFTLPLPNGGTNSFVFAAFLAPFEPGVHTVNIKGGYNGTLIRDFYAANGVPCESELLCVSQDVTYTVTAVPEPTTMAGLALAAAGIGLRRRRKQQTPE